MPRSKTHKKHIPLHKLEQTTSSGFQLKHVGEDRDEINKAALMGAHRDDHYIFILQEKGHSRAMIDFAALDLKGSALLCILPGQVHHYLHAKKVEGWFLALDVTLVSETFRPAFEDTAFSSQLLTISDTSSFIQCLELLDKHANTAPTTYHTPVLHALISSFVGMAAAAFAAREPLPSEQLSRPISITRQFRKLVAQQFVTLKNPSEYADLLNLSLSYLNEVVKDTSGFPVSYWIQQEILLEARRLLYHSEMSVKEIAYEVGYMDHTYFSRLFRKNLQCTPLELRRKYRGSSNTYP